MFTVLLTSDHRLSSIHTYHHATTLLTSAADLSIHISSVQDDLAKRVSLLSALENKLESCTADNDSIGMSFWSERVQDKKQNVKVLEQELKRCQREYSNMNTQLDALVPGTQLQVRQLAENEMKEEESHGQQTLDDLAAWKAGQDLDEEQSLFPPLEAILNGPARTSGWGSHRRHPGFGFGGPQGFPHRGTWEPPHRAFGGFEHGHHRRHHEGIRNLFERVSDVVNNPPSAASLVPTQEIKSMLDGFLANLSNQLAETFDGSRNVAEPEAERPIPGAFVQTPTQEVPAEGQDAQTQTAAAARDVSEGVKPSTRLGKGGFRHKHISCDGCLTGIRGMRYKCEVGIYDCDALRVGLTDINRNVPTTIFVDLVFLFFTPRIFIHQAILSEQCSIEVSKTASSSMTNKIPVIRQLAIFARCTSSGLGGNVSTALTGTAVPHARRLLRRLILDTAL